MKELLMGNEAIAAGAIAAGVQVVAGYPGTPSTEVLETIAKRNPGNIYVEWSINEKAAMEIAGGAAYAGARSLVTMKQVGLNVATDPLMCLNYIGVKGGMVVYVADDPGPISSQTEQDTRRFAKYAKIPIFDATSPEEALSMIIKAFDFSEQHQTPVILRATTRVCHSCASVDIPEFKKIEKPEGFTKDAKWVIFPRLSYQNKIKLEKREAELSEVFSAFKENEIAGAGKTGIACGGISYAYVKEAISGFEDKFSVLKIATPYPFPQQKAEEFLNSVDKVIVFEELDSVIEDELVYLCGKKGIRKDILGKKSGSVPVAGELSAQIVSEIIAKESDIPVSIKANETADMPNVPARPPVLCAGCPHRASFYAVKKAMKGKKGIYCGDIGCYTLGNAAPLNMVDTCLCMGAGFTIAQGLDHADDSTINFGFIGDSTFFASGITGAVNAVYNNANVILVILDNSTTAMTGHQPHPGTGITMMGEKHDPVRIIDILRAIGIKEIATVDPLDLKTSVDTVRYMADKKGVRAIIFKSPCIAIEKGLKPISINSDKCIGCKICIKELGCPALKMQDGKAVIDESLCTGCNLCAQVCPKGCMDKEDVL